VIPRLRRDQQIRHLADEWPQLKGHGPLDARHLFQGRARHRKLVVVVDDGLLEKEADGLFSQRRLLTNLLTHPYVVCYRHSDEGPPADEVRDGPARGFRTAPGWIITEILDEGALVEVPHGEAVTTTHVWPNQLTIAYRDRKSTSYAELVPGEAADQRKRDAVAVGAADELGADIYVSERPYVAERLAVRTEGVTCVDIPGALAVLGLYFRSQDTYPVHRGAPLGNRGMNKDWYSWVATHQAIPSARDWFASYEKHVGDSRNMKVVGLGSTMLRRVQRALWARDAVHIALNSPSGRDATSDALASFDEFLLLMNAAVDAQARMVHHLLELDGKEYRANWDQRRWIDEVRNAHRPLADAVARRTPAFAAIRMLSVLRNSIHGEALSDLTVSSSGARQSDILLLLDAVEQDVVYAAAREAGGPDSWGISRSPLGGGVAASIDMLIERLFHETATALTDLMARTPIQYAPHMVLPVSHPQNRSGKPTDPFRDEHRLSIAWQLGFEDRLAELRART
jgi:hypothetical protein